MIAHIWRFAPQAIFSAMMPFKWKLRYSMIGHIMSESKNFHFTGHIIDIWRRLFKYPPEGGVYELQSCAVNCSDVRWWWTGAYFDKEGETVRFKKISSKKSIGKYFFELGQVGDPSISLINSLYFIREIRPKSPKIGHPPNFRGVEKIFSGEEKFSGFFFSRTTRSLLSFPLL